MSSTPNRVRLKVIATSTNTNAFGLYRTVMVGDNRRAYAGLVNSSNRLTDGTIMLFADIDPTSDQAITTRLVTSRHMEIPERLPDPNLAVLQEVWPELFTRKQPDRRLIVEDLSPCPISSQCD